MPQGTLLHPAYICQETPARTDHLHIHSNRNIVITLHIIHHLWSLLHPYATQWTFCYIPIIPHLQNFFANPKSLTELLYQHKYHSKKGVISDVFDAEHYQALCKKKLTINGQELPHKYFSGKHNISFSVCLDGYLLYKQRCGGPSATHIIVQLYNLPPEIQTLISHTMCLGVIPGPKGPKQVDVREHDIGIHIHLLTPS